MMKDYCILNTRKFEIVNDEDLIIVPKNMAKIVNILNKKGYKIIRLIPAKLNNFQAFDILFLDKDTRLNEKVLRNICCTDIFIQFSDEYKFDTLPKGFYKLKEYNAFSCTINFYTENPFNIKTIEDLHKENEVKLKYLEEWANELPNNS